MKTRFFLLLLSSGIVSGVMGQNTIDLTFTAVDSAAYVQLDSIKVMNRTQGGEILVYWPDTTVTIDITPGDLLLYIGYSAGFPVGVRPGEQDVQKFCLFQSYPNPVFEQCHISLYIPEPGNVNIITSDIQGKDISSIERFMNKGSHSFSFIPGGASVYILKARWNNLEQTIKIINADPGPGKKCRLDYTGIEHSGYSLKTSTITSDLVMKESGILDSPDTNTSYTFQFATNIPCPGTPTIEYQGQVYNTIQIFSQCWLKENLNVGTMIQEGEVMSDNDTIEKWCYNYEPDSCTKYGGLYPWNEMMQYTSQQGAQGICPPGWHLPRDEEWKVLEGAVDSQYGIGDPEWDISNEWRGIDAGTNLKSTSGWYENGNGIDLFGFSGLPGGWGPVFDYVTIQGYWWTSSQSSAYYGAWCRSLYFDLPNVNLSTFKFIKLKAFSVRCLRD